MTEGVPNAESSSVLFDCTFNLVSRGSSAKDESRGEAMAIELWIGHDDEQGRVGEDKQGGCWILKMSKRKE